jgi:hypothetical protein
MQQTLLVQKPSWHSEKLMHALPLGLTQRPLTQLLPAQQSVSLPQVTGTPAGIQQTLFVQKPS